MKWSEAILLALLAGFAGILLKDSFALPYQNSSGGFGPGFVPLNIAAATLVLVALLAAKALFGRGEAAAAETADGPDLTLWQQALPPLGTIVLLFAATWAMQFGSVLAPLGVAMAVVSAAFLKNGVVKSIILTVVTLAAIWGIFSLWLKVPVI